MVFKPITLLSLILFTLTWLTPSATWAQKYTPAPGTEAVEVAGFGLLPQEIIWEADGAPMVLVPGGTYKIGINDAQILGFSFAEGPQAQVTVGPYYIDKHEITIGKYNVIADKATLTKPRVLGISDGEIAATGVSWADAVTCAIALGKDLPTEAEWEIAARGPLGYLYPWGNKPDAAITARMDRQKAPGSNPGDVSPYGVMDMAGNVSEWTKDYYDRRYYSTVDGKKDPVITELSESRAIRGGNFYGKSDGRATFRSAGIPIYTPEDVGFRTVYRVVPVPEATPIPTPSPTPYRTPTPQQNVSALRQELLSYFQDPSMNLPDEFKGTPLKTAPITVANFTPQELIIGFMDTADVKLHAFPTAVGPARVTRIQAPADRSLVLLAYAPNSTFGHVQELGLVNTASKALLILEPHTFNKVTRESEVILEPTDQITAKQIYEPDYRPSWHTFEVYNASALAVEVTAGPDASRTKKIVLQPGEAYRFERFAVNAKLKLSANYLGAGADQPSPSVNLTNDDRSDYRVFVLTENKDSAESVRVITRRVQPLKIVPLTALIPADIRSKYVVGTNKK